MERQYIGARYVPKFFENPNTHNATWLSGVSYEALTIVTLAGNSYTSKKTVPASVGAPNENPDYWVSTGIYNAQVEELRQEIVTTSGRVNVVENTVSDLETEVAQLTGGRKFIFITDSYGNYVNSDNKNFIAQACEYAGITNYSDFHRGSAGFTRNGDQNFLKVLQDNESAIGDKTKITDIFVFGCANDQLVSVESTITNGIRNFCTYVKANYPNARISLGALTKTWESNYVGNMDTAVRAYSYIGQFGGTYLEGTENIMAWNAFFREDHVHPTATAVDVIAKYVSDCIISGKCDPQLSPIVGSNFEAVSGDYSVSITADRSILKFNHGSSILSGSGGGAPIAISCNIPSMTTSTSNIIRIQFKLRNMFNPPIENNSNGSFWMALVTGTADGFTGFHPVSCAVSFVSTPNSDGSYTMNALFYPFSPITNITAITFLGSISMN